MSGNTDTGRVSIPLQRELEALNEKLKAIELEKENLVKQVEVKKLQAKEEELLPILELQPSYYIGMRGGNELYSGKYFNHSDVVKYKMKAEALLTKYLELKSDFDALRISI
jgi:hypothetical protein